HSFFTACLLQSALYHLPGPVVGNAGPVVRLAVNCAYFPERELAEYAPGEHFPVLFGQFAQGLPDLTCFLPRSDLLLNAGARVGYVRQLRPVNTCEAAVLFEVGIICVPGDLAEPNAHITFAPESVYGLQGLKKSVACDLFRNMLIA